jgi:outer membrane protein OmpA-like peptidoglycan-associated protein
MSYHHTSHANQEEGEKPFWISYSDLMTALMILFLVVMVASLTSISQQTIKIKEDAKNPLKRVEPTDETTDEQNLQQLSEVKSVCTSLQNQVKTNRVNVSVDCHFNRIDFGEAGRFDTDKYTLNEQGKEILIKLVPLILEVSDSPSGQKWLKRVHIQGFTDTDGSYLYNLNLSLKRSEWVMCQILSTEPFEGINLTDEQRQRAKQLFLAGGVSFNNKRSSKEASRRVELKLEFFDNSNKDPDESAPDLSLFRGNQNERCQI